MGSGAEERKVFRGFGIYDYDILDGTPRPPPDKLFIHQGGFSYIGHVFGMRPKQVS